MAGVRPLRSGDPTSLGSYVLSGFLGEGGQGSVYLGQSPSGEQVAVKLLHTRYAEDERAVRRFLREADSARRVAEFCTARVLDVGEADGRPYIVGEYVDGPSLQRQVSTEGPLRGAALVRLAVATATALAAIHKAGVIHRDFKPGNVLLGPDGPRVIDFGIARALDVSQSVSTSVVGTPAYMAPEQFLGEAQPASDVFAWAGTIVFAATGRGPFGFGALPVVMHRIMNGEPDLSGVPESLVPLLRASLSKDPHQRPTADRLLQELIRGSAPMTAPPPPVPQPSVPQPSVPQPSVPRPGDGASGPGAGWVSPGHSHPPGAGSSGAGLGTGPGAGAVTTARKGGRRLLVSVSAAATALVVGVAAWAVVRLSDGGGRTPTTNLADSPAPSRAPGGYGSGLTSVVRPSARKGGTVRVSSQNLLESTDPADMFTMYSRNMVRLYGRSLTMFKPAPGPAGAEIVPDLARSLGRSSDGGRTWTYKLRQGVRYQDGTAITSKDVKYAVLRSMDPGFAQGGLFFDTLLDLPAGYEGPYKSPGADTDRAIETPDDETIVFHLRKPLATFDQVVQLPETIPVPKARDTRADYKSAVVSSGPYQIESTREDYVALVRNPHWDPASDPNRTALPDRFVFTYGMKGDEVSTLLKAGETEMGGFLPDEEYAPILADPALKARADAPVTAVRTLAINPQVPPLDKVDCRRAVVRALELEAVSKASRAVPDQVPTSLVPPDVAGVRYADPALSPRGDKEGAREALERCGRPDGFTTKYIYRELPGEKEAAETVRDSLAKVGIHVTLDHAPVEKFHKEFGGVPANLKRDGVGLIARSWAPDWPDPSTYLPALVDSRELSEKEPSVNLTVRLPDVDELIDRATAEPDPTIRSGLWERVERRVAEEAVLVPTTWRRTLLLRGATATNLHVSPVFGDYDLVTMGVDAARS
ncbi:Oligopeptide ABC transporter, periplasmic oligopeptide-binding protein OppA (TC 3.A.1.5.1) [[Actinomadura] parvosata subsp. kistnae]|uniref:ABC transporter substrate-binding protein n=1 Tax=[Actinomadura] parvosata TaxID=1955412 RepID=UPI000D2DC14E|nr:ABC transporter substrate-binding protein [Nonomuraea sp. ATCC 55076]SPL90245.1 Oligopeptide ABC transporter, periplasmic oligopeptide-binding protein OppA (TC 3.A.1.5.1) [Actinomadura parvosata subsp. kistnae]